MSKVGKFFKKAGKAVTNTAKDVAKGTVNVANDIADGTEDVANDVAQGTVKVANDTANAVVHISKDALNETEKGFNTAIAESKKLLNEAENAILKATAADVVKKYNKEIKALAKVVKTIANNPTLKSSVTTIANKATSGNLDNEVVTALNNIFTIPEIKIQLQDIAPTTWPTITVGINGNGGYVAGVEASGGTGVTHPGIKNGQVCGYVDAGGSLGTFGASASVTLGVETSRPEGIGGGYIGIGLEADIEVGVGLEVSFNMPNFSLGGITVAVGVGMEAAASLNGGYTYVADKANYTTPW
jgi:hypothetical protein